MTLFFQNKFVRFYSSTPSICAISNNKYVMIQRFVNYTINDDGTYKNCIPTISVYKKTILDENFEIDTINVEDDFFHLPQKIDQWRRYLGLEDVRVFSKDDTNDTFEIMATHITEKPYLLTTSSKKYDIVSRINIGMCNGSYNIKNNCFENIKRINTSNFVKELKVEKNWAAFSFKNKTMFIYQWFPLKICSIDNENNASMEIEKKMPLFFKNCRGSSNGFYYKKDNEYWFVVHFVDGQVLRNYFDCIVVFDEDMNLKRYTNIYKQHNAKNKRIQFNYNIIVKDDIVILPYSLMDKETYLAIYPKKDIEEMMEN